MELVGIEQDKEGVIARVLKSSGSGPSEEVEIRNGSLIADDGQKGTFTVSPGALLARSEWSSRAICMLFCCSMQLFLNVVPIMQ